MPRQPWWKVPSKSLRTFWWPRCRLDDKWWNWNVFAKFELGNCKTHKALKWLKWFNMAYNHVSSFCWLSRVWLPPCCWLPLRRCLLPSLGHWLTGQAPKKPSLAERCKLDAGRIGVDHFLGFIFGSSHILTIRLLELLGPMFGYNHFHCANLHQMALPAVLVCAKTSQEIRNQPGIALCGESFVVWVFGSVSPHRWTDLTTLETHGS